MKLENILDVASMGLSAQRQRLAVIAENLANMNTTRTASGEPYRRRDVVLATVERDPGSFANLLDEELREATKGVRVAGIQESQAPFQRIYKPGHPDADKPPHPAPAAQQEAVKAPEPTPIDQVCFTDETAALLAEDQKNIEAFRPMSTVDA